MNPRVATHSKCNEIYQDKCPGSSGSRHGAPWRLSLSMCIYLIVFFVLAILLPPISTPLACNGTYITVLLAGDARKKNSERSEEKRWSKKSHRENGTMRAGWRINRDRETWFSFPWQPTSFGRVTRVAGTWTSSFLFCPLRMQNLRLETCHE